MSDEPDNLVLRYLRRLDERMDHIESSVDDVNARLGSLAEQVSLIRSDTVQLDHRLKRAEDRLERIEKRLDLIGARLLEFPNSPA